MSKQGNLDGSERRLLGVAMTRPRDKSEETMAKARRLLWLSLLEAADRMKEKNDELPEAARGGDEGRRAEV